MWLLKVPPQMFNQNINSVCLEAGPRLRAGAVGMDALEIPRDRQRLLAFAII